MLRHMMKNNKQQDKSMIKGDRVRIKGGSFTDHVFGTFVRYCGTQKVCVKIDNDIKTQRTLHRDSIRPVNGRDEELHGRWRVLGMPAPSSNTSASVDNNDEEDLDVLLNELSAMKASVMKMQESIAKIEARIIKECK
jgi:hypothetical protein